MFDDVFQNRLLLAAADLGRAFQAHTRRSTSIGNLLLYAGIALGFVAMLAALSYWDRRRKVQTFETDPELILFRSLCRVHGLPAADVQILTKLATVKNLERRSDLFVDPALLAETAHRPGTNADRYSRLHRRLFTGDSASA